MANGATPADRIVDVGGRDPERTPMQWEPGRGAGFTTGTPWLPIGRDADRVNVTVERDDPRSILSLHRRLRELRRAEPALSAGDWEPLPPGTRVLVYSRRLDDRRLLVALNRTPDRCDAPLPAGRWRTVIATGLDRDADAWENTVTLRGDEGLVLEPV